MANIVTADVGSLINAEFISNSIIEYVWDSPVISEKARYQSLVGVSSAAASFPRMVKGPTSISTVATETTTITTTAMTFTDTNVTVSRYGIGRGITTTAEEDNQLGEMIYNQLFIQDAARLYGELLDTLVAAQFASASSTVGTTTVALTVATMMQLVAAQRNKKVRSKQAIILHDFQLAQLQAAQAAATATAFDRFYSINADNSQYGGTFLTNDIWSSGLVPTANANADRKGAMFAVGSQQGGDDAYCAFALVMKRTPTSKQDEVIQDDAKIWISTMRAGAGTVAANFATAVISANS